MIIYAIVIANSAIYDLDHFPYDTKGDFWMKLKHG